MTQSRRSSQTVRGSDGNRGERERLDVALRAASIGTNDLRAAGALLLGRLTRRSDDLAATTALQALNGFNAAQQADAGSDAPTRLRRAGLSSLERLRRPRDDAAW